MKSNGNKALKDQLLDDSMNSHRSMASKFSSKNKRNNLQASFLDSARNSEKSLNNSNSNFGEAFND